MHNPSVSWHIISVKFFSEIIVCFWQKEPINEQFSGFECSNESSSNSSCHFWVHMVWVYTNFASLFSVMKNNSSLFFSSSLIDFGQNNPSKWNFWTFEWLGENSMNSPCLFWNQKSLFKKLCVTLKCHET